MSSSVVSFPRFLRSAVPLILGLAIGGAGAVLFVDSMPGAKGSAKERADRLELELQRAQNRILALEAGDSRSQNLLGKIRGRGAGGKRTLKDGAREIADDIREGRPVSGDDIFRASKPLLRDLAPLFDRMRLKQQQQMIDSMTGELARKYGLNADQQAQLKQWFGEKAKEEAQRWKELVGAEHTQLEDLMRASRDVRPDKGLDGFMEGVLSGDKLAAFKTERMAERAQRVERQADMKVQRLDSVVGLDDTQREQVFAIVARSSADYDPSMRLEGASGEIGAAPHENVQEAMLAVLRPEQRQAYQAERQRRREEAAKDLEAIGLTLPEGWEMFDDGAF